MIWNGQNTDSFVQIRCDVEQTKTPHDPCNRCKKMNLECRILPTSTRNLRQTKAEMRRELEELKWNMRQSGAASANATPGGSGDGQGSNFHSPMDVGAYYSGLRSGEGTDASASLSPAPVEYGESVGVSGGGSVHGLERKGSGTGSHGGTMSRALDGYVVDSKRIDDCFSLFFSQYHPLLPVLDSSISPQTPNEYYELSPFLFWTIIVTGSRQYHDDLTILDRISQLITPLAFSSMALRSTPIPVIQGLLILCTWRLPTNSMYKDMTHMLCGAAVHLATQIGLHVDGVGQDFARMPLKKDQEQRIFRARLWMYCVIVSIRTSCAEGIPPLVIADTFFDGNEKEREDTLACLPVDLQFNHKLHVVLHKAMAAMARTNLKSANADFGVLRSLIGIFDSQLLTLAATSPSEFDTFHLSCARIHILAFHFFADFTNQDTESLSRLYSLCISTLQTSNTMIHSNSFALISQSFVDRTICLAGFIILKLVRSPLAAHLDLQAGETAYFHAVAFLRSTSMQSNDLGSRCASIMTNLWGSSKIFRRKVPAPDAPATDIAGENSAENAANAGNARDGSGNTGAGKNGGVWITESLGLRLRTRLSMSLSFDMFWYWREEFGHMKNPYNGEEAGGSGQSTAQTRSGTPDYIKDTKDTQLQNQPHSQQPPHPRHPQHHSSRHPQQQQVPLPQPLSSQPPHTQILPSQTQQQVPPTTNPMPTKFDPALMGHIPMPNPATMSFDSTGGWGDGTGSDYGSGGGGGGGMQPRTMLDQFPDYDWAASFDFASGMDWGGVGVGVGGGGGGLMQGIEGGVGGGGPGGYNQFG
ncbi:hypothetical protein CC80DRAFT_155407 [Byssothecium circinans]|uniref:Xylanolytic transcriptional activator regulatory domain-containing protein n=1 Tax=Byssothecium circinans TaxID=147558 RepID=A0A6A5UGS9_9PLEO|nr:hypothetical protein CC80DRAFT_155407 [Byssothecium circinans]